MSVLLEGGCIVSDMRGGLPKQIGNMRYWQRAGRETGAKAITLRVLEFAHGVSNGIRNLDCDEVVYVLEGLATVFINGVGYSVEPETGFYLRPGDVMTVKNDRFEPVVFVSSRCPEPDEDDVPIEPVTSPFPDVPDRAPIIRLADRKALPTADRWYRVLVDEEIGSTQVTQFIGSIPPGRAPGHFHKYEEVLFILRGEGRMWAGETNTPIRPGSCIYLPKGQVHCVENTGRGELRLLGVFYPAGSPAVRYDAG
jgi:mannose-6-phosphate isomerase-like protein (cupin superfamily)